MQICKNQTTNIVYYMFEEFEDVTLTETRLIAPSFTVLDMNSTKDELNDDIPEPDLFVGSSMSYNSGWAITNQTAYDEAYAARDEKYRAEYEENMNSVMLAAQIDALGEPAVHRYTQGMSRTTNLVGTIANGGTLNQEEMDFIAGSDVGLQYQEDNAAAYALAVTEIAGLSGQAILDYTMPDFTMDPVTSGEYQPYLDYLNLGYVS